MSANPASNNDFLAAGADPRASDMHVQSGYPIWSLIAAWIARGRNDAAVIAEYQLDRRNGRRRSSIIWIIAR